MKKHCSLIVFALLTQWAVAQNQPYTPDVEARIQQVENNLGLWVKLENEPNHYSLKERMAFHRVHGVSIVVIKDYKMDWARGYGWADTAERRPVTASTLFQAASISKSLNAVGILRLAQENQLALDRDVNYYLKRWTFPYDSFSKGKTITLAHLLSHTAGLSISGFRGYEKGDTLPTLVQILNGQPPANTAAVRSVREPGVRFQYSGGGTMLSQLVVEEVTGAPYAKFMKKHVLQPMGMNNSFFDLQPKRRYRKKMATAYYNDGRALEGKYYLHPEQAAAGLWTTPTDLARFIIETQHSLRGQSNKVLTAQMTQRQLTPYVDSSMGLGVFIAPKGGDTYFEHNGSNKGFISHYSATLEGGNGVVIMANTDSPNILMELLASVATVYGWKGVYNPVVRKRVTPPADILDQYIGEYSTGTTTMTVQKQGNDLVLFTGQNQWKLQFTDEHTSFAVEVPYTVFRFTKNASNRVDGLERRSGSRVVKAQKVN